jgi:hypothetical protein
MKDLPSLDTKDNPGICSFYPICSHNEKINSIDRQYDQPQHEPLLCQTLNSNGRQYIQPPQNETPLCQTTNSNNRQYKHPQQYRPLLCQALNSNG